MEQNDYDAVCNMIQQVKDDLKMRNLTIETEKGPVILVAQPHPKHIKVDPERQRYRWKS